MNFVIKLSVLVLSCIFTICITSCHSRTTPIDNLADLTEDVKANYQDYTEEDWNTFAQEYELIEQELEEYKDQYSDQEKKEIGRLKGECYAYITKYAIKTLRNNVEDAIKEAEGMIEGFTNAFQEGNED